MPRSEDVMPEGPPTLADRLVCVVATDDRLRGNEALALPFRETLAQELERLGFASEVGVIWGCITKSLRGVDPADAIKAFLKDIAHARHEVVICPAT